jgi:chromosome segregation ATPase
MSKKFNQSHANKIIATIEQVESDRDEWKLQHENLLSVRQSDLQAIAKLESDIAIWEEYAGKQNGKVIALTAELSACRKELEEAKEEAEKLRVNNHELRAELSALRKELEAAEEHGKHWWKLCGETINQLAETRIEAAKATIERDRLAAQIKEAGEPVAEVRIDNSVLRPIFEDGTLAEPNNIPKKVFLLNHELEIGTKLYAHPPIREGYLRGDALKEEIEGWKSACHSDENTGGSK